MNNMKCNKYSNVESFQEEIIILSFAHGSGRNDVL